MHICTINLRNIKFILAFLILRQFDVAASSHEENTTIKKIVVPPEKRPPSHNHNPVMIEFSIFVVDINSINVEDMDFRVDMFVHQKWRESRLTLTDDLFEDGDDYVTLPPEHFENLWQPDPYFLNSKVAEIATLTHKFSTVTLYKNKTIRYAARLHAIIACQMEFQLYPMDIQICPIHIESFSYSNSKVRLKWAEAGVNINPELKLLQYNLGAPLQLEETDGYMPEKDGNFSRLTVYFRFERQIGHHLIQTFAPSSLVVMLSWFSFWLGLDAIPGRVTLLVTCMLTLVTMFTGADIPPVAYVKAMDLWMAGCMVFVFAALAEFVVVKVLDVQYQQQLKSSSKQTILPLRLTSTMEKGQCQTVAMFDGTNVRSRKANAQNTPTPVSQTNLQGNGKPINRRQSILSVSWTDNDTGVEKIMWREIDKLSRVVFPGLFLVFVVLYWPILLFKTSS
ncbi:hypothetical protein ACKWTF_000154 [Chironomus riparius]